VNSFKCQCRLHRCSTVASTVVLACAAAAVGAGSKDMGLRPLKRSLWFAAQEAAESLIGKMGMGG
jgi:hypothetical protein